MVLKVKTVTCQACLHAFEATPKLSPLGFQKFHCPTCNHGFIHPLVQRVYFAIMLLIFTLIALLSLVGFTRSSWGEGVLTVVVLGSIYVLERVSYLLFPLAVWAVLRLAGMHYPSLLTASRTVLWWTGRLAFLGIIVGILGGASSLILRGLILELLLGALISAIFILLVLIRDKLIRNRLENI